MAFRRAPAAGLAALALTGRGLFHATLFVFGGRASAASKRPWIVIRSRRFGSHGGAPGPGAPPISAIYINNNAAPDPPGENVLRRVRNFRQSDDSAQAIE